MAASEHDLAAEMELSRALGRQNDVGRGVRAEDVWMCLTDAEAGFSAGQGQGNPDAYYGLWGPGTRLGPPR